ncbi:hypothetical protein E2320_014011 [Naja naja]|nr:hypothetical protein E2320_014011 [Naja naja]
MERFCEDLGRVHQPNPSKMASRWDLCSFSCPPTSVTIQPPPFTITVPGPSLFCPDQPLCIDQYNPCVPPCGGLSYNRPRPLILASTSSQKTVLRSFNRIFLLWQNQIHTSSSTMSCGRMPCYSSCPPVTVTVQPPPFTLSIPGPSLYCPDQPLCIDQCNPCVPPPPLCPPITRRSYASSVVSSPSLPQKSLPRSQSYLSSSSLGPAKMASGWNCYTSCPPMMVTIQPPVYTLNIPGPSLYCADQSVCVEQCNPCAAIPSSGIINHGAYGLLPANAPSDFSCSSQKSLESSYYF